MNGKANYTTVYIGADEVEDIQKIADRVERALEFANGFSIQARDHRESQVVDPMRLAITMKVSAELNRRQQARNRTAPDGTPFRRD